VPAFSPADPPDSLAFMAPNTLYYGDNLEILRRYVADESGDPLCAGRVA